MAAKEEKNSNHKNNLEKDKFKTKKVANSKIYKVKIEWNEEKKK